MRNLVKYLSVGLLVIGLAACDQKKKILQGSTPQQASRIYKPSHWLTENSASLCQPE